MYSRRWLDWVGGLCVVLAASAVCTLAQAEQLGTKFTYQGSLERNGSLVTGVQCDFRFGLWDAAEAGVQQGASPQTVTNVSVDGGVFTATMDFGANTFQSHTRWLEIEVNCPGDPPFPPFVLLSPRVELTAAPQALDLRLPYSAYVGTGPGENVFSVTNANAGGVAYFETYGGGAAATGMLAVAHGAGPAVYGYNDGTGRAARFDATNATSTSDAIFANTSGLGRAGNFEINNPDNTEAALYATTNGSGPAIVANGGSGKGLVAATNSEVAAVYGYNYGFGPAASFEVNNMENNAAALYAATYGTGPAIQGYGMIESLRDGFKYPDGTIQTTAAGGGGFWSLAGNAGTTPDTHFVGTTDNVDLVLRVSNDPAFRLQPGSSQFGTPNIVGGHYVNSVTSGVDGAAIGGGGGRNAFPPYTSYANRVTDNYGTVAGGLDNQAGDAVGTTSDRGYASVGGGEGNTASGQYAVVDGGNTNTASGTNSAVGGGYSNLASGSRAAVGGGYSNEASGSSSAIGGGYDSTASGNHSTIAGGDENLASGSGSTVSGGYANQATGDYSAVGGGYSNFTNGNYATVGGGYSNTGSGYRSTVSGGYSNVASLDYAAIGGGYNNTASQLYSTVGGGRSNIASASYAVISGGGESTPGTPATANRVTDDYGTVGGGGNNQAGDNAGTTSDRIYATVCGGYHNLAAGSASTVVGGRLNEANNDDSFVGCGWNNLASGYGSAVVAGALNKAAGDQSFVGGGYANSASGYKSVVPGGEYNMAGGKNSFAAGSGAKVRNNEPLSPYYSGDSDGDQGTFVWADSTAADLVSVGANEFLVRASGGMWFGTTSAPSIPAGRFLNTSTGGYLTTGGVWTDSSDREKKESFESVDRTDLLERLALLPITRWSFKDGDPSVEHLGPVAQDFHAAFGLGDDDKHIAALDTSGVALAAIQGLYQIVQEKDCEVEKLRSEIEDLKELVKALGAQNGGGR